MRNVNRTHLSIAAATLALTMVAGGGAVFAASQAAGSGGSLAKVDADTLNGYRAKDLVQGATIQNNKILNSFNTCPFTTKLSATVIAPRSGYIMVSGSVGAARDLDFPDPAELAVRLKVGPRVISGEVATQLVTTGSFDGNASVQGIVRVRPGKRTIDLQLSECGAGSTAAFVTSRTISTLFIPFGSSKLIALPAGKRTPSNR